MAAEYDKNQRFSFVYSNLYQIYRKGKAAAKAADLRTLKGNTNYHVLKTEGVENAPHFRKGAAPEIRPYRPVELMGKRVQREEAHEASTIRARSGRRPSVEPGAAPEDPTLKSLKDNLSSLNDLHSRLRFMLKELEDLVND